MYNIQNSNNSSNSSNNNNNNKSYKVQVTRVLKQLMLSHSTWEYNCMKTKMQSVFLYSKLLE